MEWFFNPQIDYRFSALGKVQGEDYTINEHALDILNEINCKLAYEDRTLRTFRRAIGLGQYVKNDLLPFLINVKEHKLVDTTIRILVNLTVPVECLFSIEIMMRTEAGRRTVGDLSTLLATSKESFADVRAIRSIVDYMKNILEKDTKLSFEQCDSVNNCLLLLRNILHIPENATENSGQMNYLISMQNKIVWYLFTLSIDKLLIYLISCPQRSYWCVAVVQFLAVMYKDQQASHLQKLLNTWLEDSLSDSSEDFESNTSPPKEDSDDSSPMLTSDPTSDSSDNGGGGNGNGEKVIEDRRPQSNMDVESAFNINAQKSDYSASMINRTKPNEIKQMSQEELSSDDPSPTVRVTFDENPSLHPTNKATEVVNGDGIESNTDPAKNTKCQSTSELSDCGYVTHQESISTSSNEDNYPCQKLHQKPPPCNQKRRFNAVNNPRVVITVQEQKDLRRKKLVKRSKTSLIHMKGLVHHTPTDEDISNILKEFTVDFLLKGYGYLVQDLYSKLICDLEMQNQIDTSHFFWLVTYFLKFAAQLELNLEHIKGVLSFNIVSYLTYEAVSLYEQLELTSRHQEMDMKPCLRRMHLVVTAIREFVQALNTYNKIQHLGADDVEYIRLLLLQISVTDDITHLFILLIRNYNPSIQSKQYLQDLIVTNHLLLLIPESVSDGLDRSRKVKLREHIQQFATVEVMQRYGLLLESFLENGEFVNDCIFTMMHHIGGDLGQVTTLFQPIILRTYAQIYATDYQLCEDWSDLIEYVIKQFIKTPQRPPMCIEAPSLVVEMTVKEESEEEFCDDNDWSKEEIDILYWYWEQSKSCLDIVGEIIKLFSLQNKTKYRIPVIQQLLQQDIVTRSEYNALMKYENEEYERNFKSVLNQPMPNEATTSTSTNIDNNQSEASNTDIQVLKDKLLKENKGKQILWLQKILLEYCFAKLCYLNHRLLSRRYNMAKITTVEPIPHHCILKKQSMPIVPWNSEQSNILLYQPFILLLHKLGLHLPVDAGKLFVRIPEFWTPDILFNVAEKLGPIDKSILKFHRSELNKISFESMEKSSDGQLNNGEHTTKTEEFCTAFPANLLNTSSIIKLARINPCKAPTDWIDCLIRGEAANLCDNIARHLYFSSSSISLANIPSTVTPSNTMKSNDIQMDVDVESTVFTSPPVPYPTKLFTIETNDEAVEQTEENECRSVRDDASVAESVTSDLIRMCVSDEEDKSYHSQDL